MKDDIMEIKKEVSELKEQSLAMELLKDQRNQNRRMFYIILVILVMWFATIGYLVYVLNDIGTETTTETTTETYEVEQDSEDGGNNNFIHGNDNEVE